MAKRIGIILLSLFILLIIAWRIDRTFFHPYQPEREAQIRDDVTTLKFTVPKTEEACLAAGGLWEKPGPRPAEECNLPTKDAGKLCESSNVCEGVCLADLTSDQLSQGMRGKMFKTRGVCSPVIKIYGCRGYVYRGWASVVCVD
ncbi:hypothetical protein A2363_03890 [Candidatus Gottesmanbacteria bacterium RIFOXYB1_FULL_47_11]|uniref:Uncharacterized protein n=1 Tax=Candidatus Gottesmanbacteria bacterium RIFOXYB1_FULL_47_11 TaxID=1798401 RepID=A0A1F6BE13_9BACT|nr:MAG: hypothetical protein A2363_03890 [Candidatus Gottesmanbacteria bacterium RIFOXYB1_FULL_47_11]